MFTYYLIIPKSAMALTYREMFVCYGFIGRSKALQGANFARTRLSHIQSKSLAGRWAGHLRHNDCINLPFCIFVWNLPMFLPVYTQVLRVASGQPKNSNILDFSEYLGWSYASSYIYNFSPFDDNKILSP